MIVAAAVMNHQQLRPMSVSILCGNASFRVLFHVYDYFHSFTTFTFKNGRVGLAVSML